MRHFFFITTTVESLHILYVLNMYVFETTKKNGQHKTCTHKKTKASRGIVHERQSGATQNPGLLASPARNAKIANQIFSVRREI